MSAFAYGRIVRTRRAQAAANISMDAQTEATGKLVDSVAALVPSEILAAHAYLVAKWTKTDDQGTTSIVDAGALEASLVGLVVLTFIAYLIGRGFANWQPADLIRLFLPPLAFLAWAALLGTSALTPWITKLAAANSAITIERVVIGAVVLAVLLIGINTRVNPAK